jgi:DNA replication protein DnaC
MSLGAGVLRERDAELERIGAAIEEAGRGRGRLIVIEGGPGLGKTRLLAAACDSAVSCGLTVLRARGGEQERMAPFGVVR